MMTSQFAPYVHFSTCPKKLSHFFGKSRMGFHIKHIKAKDLKPPVQVFYKAHGATLLLQIFGKYILIFFQYWYSIFR